MKQKISSFYRFLPVQLFFLHFRKYQLLLIFWLILFATISHQFAVHFGAASLFLSPEYLGEINIFGFFLLGGATAIFSMSWHITTFIIHSKRLPFLGTTRNAFFKYCINNAIIPMLFLICYGIFTFRFLNENEPFSTLDIFFLLISFYTGYGMILLISFSYFFKVDKDILKSVLSTIANTTLIRNMIPYDTLDREFDLVRSDSYLDKLFRIKKIKIPYRYNQRLVAIVLRRHHRNAMFAIFVAFLLLLLLGAFMDKPLLRIPAGAGFLLLFTVMMAVLGAFKYFLRSWEIMGWLSVIGIISLLTYYKAFDLRSIAYGMNYKSKDLPIYDYTSLNAVFTDSLYEADKQQELIRLNTWLEKRAGSGSTSGKPPLIIVSVSGGGSRASYWTFRCLQVADSLTNGMLFKNMVLISGASGGMIGAAYWRSVHLEAALGNIADPYAAKFQENIGKDLLNSIVFSLATVDFISPFNKITVAGRRYSKDRGYAFDNQLIANTDNLLNKTIQDFYLPEKQGLSPMVLTSATIINDGRKLLISSQPTAYLTRSTSSLGEKEPVIDAVDFTRFFKNQDPYNLKLATALRMSATFPLLLPVLKLPSTPNMDIMDAGLRDNYGVESSSRYLHTFKDWMKENIGDVIYIQIRDTKQAEPSEPEEQNTMSAMLFDPIFTIQKRWSSFQTYHQSYLLDYLKDDLAPGKFHQIIFQYIPIDKEKAVALNFHLTTKEKSFLQLSIQNPDNQRAFLQLQKLLVSPHPFNIGTRNQKMQEDH